MQKFENNTKRCSTCKEIKPISDFHKDKRRNDGLNLQCKVCKRKYRISEYYKNREKELEKTPEWKKRKHKYRRSEKGHHMDSKKDHAITSGCDIHILLTFEDWETILKGQDYKCAVCQCKFSPELKYTKDCIIPMCKGGMLTFDNTQALCMHCNAIKHQKMYSGLGNRWRAKLSTN